MDAWLKSPHHGKLRGKADEKLSMPAD